MTWPGIESDNWWTIWPVVREIGVQSQVKSYQKLKKKMVLNISLINTKYYKDRDQG